MEVFWCSVCIYTIYSLIYAKRYTYSLGRAGRILISVPRIPMAWRLPCDLGLWYTVCVCTCTYIGRLHDGAELNRYIYYTVTREPGRLFILCEVHGGPGVELRFIHRPPVTSPDPCPAAASSVHCEISPYSFYNLIRLNASAAPGYLLHPGHAGEL